MHRVDSYLYHKRVMSLELVPQLHDRLYLICPTRPIFVNFDLQFYFIPYFPHMEPTVGGGRVVMASSPLLRGKLLGVASYLKPMCQLTLPDFKT